MRTATRLINSIIVFIASNLYGFYVISKRIDDVLFIAFFAIVFILINIFPSYHGRRFQTALLRVCNSGNELLIIFLISSTLSAAYIVFLGFSIHTQSFLPWSINLLIALIAELIVFWNGIIRVYLTSKQLYVKWRVIGALAGWIPVVNLFVLLKIIGIVHSETWFENKKILTNEARKAERICSTKYPLLLVHGVFFRDFKYLNYWGRIPTELMKNGATVFYGNQQSALSSEACGKEIAERIRQVLIESGAKKVNIIAHSKGGLDCRCAISQFGAENCVASLTTINTPHRGCIFADYLLSKIPKKVSNSLAKNYNRALIKFGDTNPDFLAAVRDLTANSCRKMNDAILDSPSVYYQSVGSKLNRATGGRLPLNLSYPLVRHFDGPNDGLVSTESFKWGEKCQMVTVKGRRGISHGDMIDLYRENIKGFDVREFYVELVHDLKLRGF